MDPGAERSFNRKKEGKKDRGYANKPKRGKSKTRQSAVAEKRVDKAHEYLILNQRVYLTLLNV